MGRKTVRPYRRKPVKTVTYSNETTLVQIPVTITQGQATVQQNTLVIPGSNQQGKRKAKNFTLRMKTDSDIPLFWALLYVPEGLNPSMITLSASGSMYEPAQNVIMSGIISKNSAQDTFRSRLARNLNSGDRIILSIRPALNDVNFNGSVQGICNYVISY